MPEGSYGKVGKEENGFELDDRAAPKRADLCERVSERIRESDFRIADKSRLRNGSFFAAFTDWQFPFSWDSARLDCNA